MLSCRRISIRWGHSFCIKSVSEYAHARSSIMHKSYSVETMGP